MVHDVLPTGHLAEIIQILRTPNKSPATVDTRFEVEPPRVYVNQERDTYMHEDGTAHVAVTILVKGVSGWNRPLRPRPEASEEERREVLQSQVQYDRDRLKEIENVVAPVIQDLFNLGATDIHIVGSSGWISADLPVNALERLSSDIRLAVISLLETKMWTMLAFLPHAGSRRQLTSIRNGFWERAHVRSELMRNNSMTRGWMAVSTRALTILSLLESGRWACTKTKHF
jgi:hypothetical protein